MCGLNFSTIYFDVETHDLWEGIVTIRSETQTESIYILGIWDKRDGVILRRLILQTQATFNCIPWEEQRRFLLNLMGQNVIDVKFVCPMIERNHHRTTNVTCIKYDNLYHLTIVPLN